ncbi:MAG: 6-phosphogluconolactonase [Acidobacteriaceae bacterium]
MRGPDAMHRFKAEDLNVEIHADPKSASEAAANDAARTLARLGEMEDEIGVVFATGASQMSTLEALTSMPALPWNKVGGFHLDEYVGLPVEHPASFRGYLRRYLTSKVAMREFYEIDGTAANVEEVGEQYAARLRVVNPRLCLLGVGENGHLAFNDPAEADFEDVLDVKIVRLDAACRQQQVSEGWFGSLDEVPQRAITVTIPALFRVPRLILTVVGPRKAQAVKDMLRGPISTSCPASILRQHSDATVYLDREAAAYVLA